MIRALAILLPFPSCHAVSAQEADEAHYLFPEQVPKLWTVPNAVDSNRDGALSSDEVMAAPQALVKLDKNGDGGIDAQEMGAFQRFLPMVRQHNITKVIEADGDMHISAEELANASVALINLDANGDWRITAEGMAVGDASGSVHHADIRTRKGRHGGVDSNDSRFSDQPVAGIGLR